MHNEPMPKDQAAPASKAELKAEISSARKELAKEILQTRAEVSGTGERLAALILRTRSDLMEAVEGAVFKSEKVDRDQALTRDRLDGLEKRVALLESHRGRRP